MFAQRVTSIKAKIFFFVGVITSLKLLSVLRVWLFHSPLQGFVLIYRQYDTKLFKILTLQFWWGDQKTTDNMLFNDRPWRDRVYGSFGIRE